MDKRKLLAWRPHTTALLISGVLVLVVASTVAFMASSFRPTTEVKIGQSGNYRVWVAQDEPSRVLGLSGVDSLKPNGGLLMVFDSDGTWGIWMKDMKVPLDILWLDANKKVVYIVKNASPEARDSATFTPKEPARYVLELPAGSVQNSAIKVGDVAIFTIGGGW